MQTPDSLLKEFAFMPAEGHVFSNKLMPRTIPPWNRLPEDVIWPPSIDVNMTP